MPTSPGAIAGEAIDPPVERAVARSGWQLAHRPSVGLHAPLKPSLANVA